MPYDNEELNKYLQGTLNQQPFMRPPAAYPEPNKYLTAKRLAFEEALIAIEAIDSSINIQYWMGAYDKAHAPKPKDYACGSCGTTFTISRIPACCPVCMVKL